MSRSQEGGSEGDSWMSIFVRVQVESRVFLVTCLIGSLAVRTMSVLGCSVGHSSF